jgi:predicted HicB family RNase H-like nuclease
MNETKKNRQMMLAVSKELHAQLVALAQADGRKIYWLTNDLLARALRQVADERELQEEATNE